MSSRLNHPLALAQTFLFVPGNRPERFEKALETGSHAVIIDLEDAVALDEMVLLDDVAGLLVAALGPRAAVVADLSVAPGCGRIQED